MTAWSVTLESLRNNEACFEMYNKLVCFLTNTEFDESVESYIHCSYQESIPLLTVLESNGLCDALWTLRCLNGKEKDIRHYSVWIARQVQHLMRDTRSLNALDVAERFADGKATEEELKVAFDAAVAATTDACAAADAWDTARIAADSSIRTDFAASGATYAACAGANAAADACATAVYAACADVVYTTATAEAASNTNDSDAERVSIEVKQTEMFRLMVAGQAPWQRGTE